MSPKKGLLLTRLSTPNTLARCALPSLHLRRNCCPLAFEPADGLPASVVPPGLTTEVSSRSHTEDRKDLQVMRLEHRPMRQLPPGIIVYEGVGLDRSTAVLLATDPVSLLTAGISRIAQRCSLVSCRPSTYSTRWGARTLNRYCRARYTYTGILCGGPKYPKEAL